MRIVAVIVMLTAGCTGSTNYWNPYTPIQAQTKLDKDAAVQKAVIAITDAGKEVESSDAGVVLTKWFSGDGFGGDQNRFRIRVVVQQASYGIEALCQSKAGSSGAWNDNCDGSKRPQFVLDTMNRIDAALK
jgi:hypothetical protein